MAAKSSTKWSSGVFDCCEDKLSCCYAFWCWPCFACPISEALGERSLLPLLDMFTPGGLSMAGIPLCVAPVALSLRTALRRKYGIEGTLLNDILMTCACNMCVWCQMDREIKRRSGSTGLSPTPVTAQPGK